MWFCRPSGRTANRLKPARRSAGDDKPSIYERFPGLTREENDARQRENDEERGGQAEGGEGYTEQGGRDGGRERSSQ